MNASTLIVMATAAALLLPLSGCDSTGESAHASDAVLEPAELGSVGRMHTMGDLHLASQPGVEDLEEAKSRGVRTVINQRNEGENTAFDEREVVTSLGMHYENPGFGSPDQLTDEVIDETRNMLRTAERPILMHCASANRTGAIWFAYRTLDDGLDEEAALAEAKMVGLRSPGYEEVVRDYIRRHR